LRPAATARAGLLVQQVGEADAHLLVAGRVGVGQVVGHGVQLLLLGGHAGGGGAKSFEHAGLWIGGRRAVL
jgi:hypothetical protein